MSVFTTAATRQKTRPLALSAFVDPHTMAQVSRVGENLHTLDSREAGVSPVLPRNCERGRNLRKATGRTAGKVQGVGRSVSQET